ncbi:MAG: type II secretion system GspH family protein [Desulfomonile sp.]|nr:type II secretion system GspH family protein [Desulfomonile sp.]
MIRWRSLRQLGPGRNSRSKRGFTILEIVAVLAVMTLALGIGLYSMGDWRARGKYSGIINGVRNAVQLTRARAIARQKPVVLQFARPVPRSQWTHSENYLVIERRSDDTLADADPTDNNRPYYWIEFRFVDERLTDDSAEYSFQVGPTGALRAIDSTLSYNDADVNRRGQICFDGRGYAVAPPCEWKPTLNGTCFAVPPSFTPVPREYIVEIGSRKLNRTVDVTVSALGLVATRLP